MSTTDTITTADTTTDAEAFLKREVPPTPVRAGLPRRQRRQLRNLSRLSRIHTTVVRRSGGRLARRFRGLDLVLLTTTGRRSGEARTVALVAVRDGEDFVVAASSAGVDREPDWRLNLLADPSAVIEHAGARWSVVARELEGEAREVWWARLVERLGDYQRYQDNVSRRVAVLRLVPTYP